MTKKHDTEAVKKTMQKLFDKSDGKLTVTAVIAEATKASSPLHPLFEWDDKAAAAEHRKDQARRLIRRVKVTYEDDNGEEHEGPVYHVPSIKREEGVYKPATAICRSQSEYERALGQALSKLRSAQSAVTALRNAAGTEPDADIARIGVALEAISAAQTALTMH